MKILIKQIVNEVMLYEGLEMTHAIDVTLSNLMRKWNFDNCVGYEENNNSIKMMIYTPIDGKDFNVVLKHIENFFGYFPAHISTKMANIKYDYTKAVELLTIGRPFNIYFEAKYDQEICQSKIPSILYHIAPSVYEDKILKLGLVPKEKSKLSKHPSRIYLGLSETASRSLIKAKSFTQNITKFTLFLIDFKQLKQARKIIMFADPQYATNGCYTYENIPPQYISVVERIDITKEEL